MKVLHLNLKYFLLMGINVNDRDEEPLARKMRYLFILTGTLCSLGFACTVHFILNFTNWKSAVNSMIALAALIACVTSCISFWLKTKEIRYFCKEVQLIVDKGKAFIDLLVLQKPVDLIYLRFLQRKIQISFMYTKKPNIEDTFSQSTSQISH